MKNRNAPIFFVVFQPSLAILCPFRKVQCWWTTLSLLRWRAAYNDYDYPLGRSNFQHLWHNRPSQKKGGSRRKRSVKKKYDDQQQNLNSLKGEGVEGGGAQHPPSRVPLKLNGTRKLHQNTVDRNQPRATRRSFSNRIVLCDGDWSQRMKNKTEQTGESVRGTLKNKSEKQVFLVIVDINSLCVSLASRCIGGEKVGALFSAGIAPILEKAAGICATLRVCRHAVAEIRFGGNWGNACFFCCFFFFLVSGDFHRGAAKKTLDVGRRRDGRHRLVDDVVAPQLHHS